MRRGVGTAGIAAVTGIALALSASPEKGPSPSVGEESPRIIAIYPIETAARDFETTARPDGGDGILGYGASDLPVKQEGDAVGIDCFVETNDGIIAKVVELRGDRPDGISAAGFAPIENLSIYPEGVMPEWAESFIEKHSCVKDLAALAVGNYQEGLHQAPPDRRYS